MSSAISDRQRRHRTATSKALVRAVRYCKACGRGQVPSKRWTPDEGSAWTCRYCQHDHKDELPGVDDILDDEFTGGLKTEEYLERLRNGRLS